MELLFLASYVPFTLALGLLAALFLLELCALVLGGTIFGTDHDLHLDADHDIATATFDLDPGEVPDLHAMIAAADAPRDLPTGAAAPGIMGLLGLDATPVMIWFAALLLGFGLSGLVLQSIMTTLASAPLAPVWAVVVALPVGLVFAKRFSRGFAALLPRFETTATSIQFLGGMRGRVTQGLARRGSAAEVRLVDRHGNTHYLRCEPLLDSDEITEGTDVLTVRLRTAPNQWTLRVIAIS